jgi:hypothetical protein
MEQSLTLQAYSLCACARAWLYIVCSSLAIQRLDVSSFRPSTLVVAGEASLLLNRNTEPRSSVTPVFQPVPSSASRRTP